MNYRRITIPLSEAEQAALRRAASQECRRPRDHARYVILRALGLGNEGQQSTKSNTGAVRQDANAGVVELAR